MTSEGELEQRGRHRSRVKRVCYIVASVIIMELNNCFPNYRRCETAVKAAVCSSLLGENEVIECSSQQINDMVFATWHSVLIIIGRGGLLHIVCKHRYDLMK